MKLIKTNTELEALKSQIGFGMAFKATLGFYAAQFLAQTVGLLIVGSIIVGAIMFLSSAVKAEEVPAALKDAEIVVSLKDGSQAKFSANDWKVVPRIDKKKAQPVAKAEEKNNRISVLGGYGSLASLKKSVDASGKASINTREGIVGGLQYQRKVSDRISIGAQGQTNKTFSLLLGLDF